MADPFQNLIGIAPRMQEIRKLVSNISPYTYTVSILGRVARGRNWLSAAHLLGIGKTTLYRRLKVKSSSHLQ